MYVEYFTTINGVWRKIIVCVEASNKRIYSKLLPDNISNAEQFGATILDRPDAVDWAIPESHMTIYGGFEPQRIPISHAGSIFIQDSFQLTKSPDEEIVIFQLPSFGQKSKSLPAIQVMGASSIGSICEISVEAPTWVAFAKRRNPIHFSSGLETPFNSVPDIPAPTPF